MTVIIKRSYNALSKLFLLQILLCMLISSCSISKIRNNSYEESQFNNIKNQIFPFVIWKTAIGGSNNSYSNLHPNFASGIVYAASRKGIVKAINVNNGKEIWSINLAKKKGWLFHISPLLSSGLTISSKHIYIGSEKSIIYALNIKNGKIVWQAHAAGEVLSNPVVKDNMVLIHTSNGQLQAFDEINGTLKWSIILDTTFFSLRGESTPTIVFGTAIVGSDDGYVNAISINHGQIIWRQRISQVRDIIEHNQLNDVDVTPIVANGIVYAIAYNGNLAAIDFYNGQIIWKRNLGSANNFIINSNCIYLVDRNNQLLALNANNGMVLWIQDNLPNHVLTSPIMYNNYLIVGDNKGYIYWINPLNGNFLAQQKINCSGFSTVPIVADNKLIIQSKDGNLYAITS